MRIADFDATVDPLFYDGLSGDFKPECDPELRTHNLARLLVATLTKGELVVDELQKELYFEYQPSWAEGIVTTAVGSLISGKLIDIDYLQLEAREQGSLSLRYHTHDHSLYSQTDGNSVGVLRVIGEHKTEDEYAVLLGNDLDEAQERIAASAQQFFDSLR